MKPLSVAPVPAAASAFISADKLRSRNARTSSLFRKFKNTARVGKNAVSDKVVAISARQDSQFEDIRHLVAGAAGRELLQSGDLEKGIFWAGMVQGLIHDIPSCQELIDRIIGDAEEIVKRRLCGLC